MNQQRFTLLRLPIIAVEDVIKHLYADDQYTFSRITKRTRGIMKSLSRRLPPYSLMFIVNSESCQYCIGTTGDRSVVYHFKAVGAPYRYFTEDDDFADEIIYDIKEISDVFNKPEISLTVQKRWQMEPMIEAAKELGLKLFSISVTDREVLDYQSYNDLMNDSKDAEIIEICSRAPRDYRLEEGIRFSCTSVELKQAHWFTLDVLEKYFMDCVTLKIQGCKVPFESLRPVVESLIEKATIKDLCIRRLNGHPAVTVDTILGDLPRERIQHVYPEVTYFPDGYLIKMKNGEDILECCDGMIFVMTQNFERGTNPISDESDFGGDEGEDEGDEEDEDGEEVNNGDGDE